MKRIIVFLVTLEILFGSAAHAKDKSRVAPFRFNSSIQKPVPLYPTLNDRVSIGVPDRKGLTIGVKAGSTAGLSGAMGDLMYSLSHVVPGAAIRGSVGYLTGSNIKEGDNIKIATVNLDGVLGLNFLKNENVPIDIYVGGGLIYPWKVNKDRGSGGWGAHAYMGGKYFIEKNTSIYGELAYSGIKYSHNTSALKGFEAMLGYGYSF